MRFSLPALPFGRKELEPWMSGETIEYHYGKHHRAYVEKTNSLIAGTRFETLPLERIVIEAEGKLLNQAAQAWNHTFFWQCLTPPRSGRKPPAAIESAAREAFGSLGALRQAFLEQGKEIFGSGWIWLVRPKAGGNLELFAGKDADNPLRLGYSPVLVCDVWEHAYYLDYRNDRGKFLESAWHLMNWEFAERNLASDFEATPLMTAESRAA